MTRRVQDFLRPADPCSAVWEETTSPCSNEHFAVRSWFETGKTAGSTDRSHWLTSRSSIGRTEAVNSLLHRAEWIMTRPGLCWRFDGHNCKTVVILYNDFGGNFFYFGMRQFCYPRLPMFCTVIELQNSLHGSRYFTHTISEFSDVKCSVSDVTP